MRRKNYLILFVLFVLSCSFGTLKAQSAKTVLDKMSNLYTKHGGVKIDFSMDFSQGGNSPESKVQTICILKRCFKLDAGSQIVWYDGNTQWVYSTDTEEVNITTPTHADLMNLSPILMFDTSDFKSVLNGIVKDRNGNLCSHVSLYPLQKNSDFKKIDLWIRKVDSMISQIKTVDESDNSLSLYIKKTLLNQDFPNDFFKFDKTKYPKAEVVDLR